MDRGFTLFDTSFGSCGIAWAGSAVRGLQLPEADEVRAWSRLKSRFPELDRDDPPDPIRAAIDAVSQFLSGAIQTDLATIALDLESVGDWERQVYVAARAIPVGSTTTYGALASRFGDPLKSRAVGHALGRNPWPIVIPCHRITAAGGAVGGFSAPGGRTTKLRLLELEGALAVEALPLFSPPDD